jgi:hypothetical protein
MYDNPIPTRFLAPIDCSKIQALGSIPVSDTVESEGRQMNPTAQQEENYLPRTQMQEERIPSRRTSQEDE